MGKKRIYVKVLAVVAAVFVIGGIIAKTVDKRQQMYYERISEMLDANWKYQHDLSIEGTLDLFSFDFNLDGINWKSMSVDRYLIYARILEIRLFVPEYVIDYTSVDQLLEEYDSFCNTGRNSKILDEFHKGCEMAAAQISEKEIQFDDIVSMMAWLGKGKLKIENGEMIEDKEAGEGIYLSDFSDEELMELCRMFEGNSDVIIDYMMEKGKLKEMEKNEKG